MTRRHFGVMAAGLFTPFAFDSGCALTREPRESIEGRLTARPLGDVKTTARGTQALGLGSTRDAVLQLPARATDAPLPLIVLLHGAGGSAERFLRRFGTLGDDLGVAILAPDSRGSTWDAIRGGYGPDVTFLNAALERVFRTVAVDPARIAVGGFSDGATYGLSLGLINGDLFRRVVAFSPGFVIGGAPHGKPQIFVSHGRADTILPIDRCGRAVVADLRAQGYDVTFREFEGEHEVPPAIAAESLAWVAGK
jgi:predicted esterase